MDGVCMYVSPATPAWDKGRSVEALWCDADKGLQ